MSEGQPPAGPASAEMMEKMRKFAERVSPLSANLASAATELGRIRDHIHRLTVKEGDEDVIRLTKKEDKIAIKAIKTDLEKVRSSLQNEAEGLSDLAEDEMFKTEVEKYLAKVSTAVDEIVAEERKIDEMLQAAPVEPEETASPALDDEPPKEKTLDEKVAGIVGLVIQEYDKAATREEDFVVADRIERYRRVLGDDGMEKLLAALAEQDIFDEEEGEAGAGDGASAEPSAESVAGHAPEPVVTGAPPVVPDGAAGRPPEVETRSGEPIPLSINSAKAKEAADGKDRRMALEGLIKNIDNSTYGIVSGNGDADNEHARRALGKAYGYLSDALQAIPEDAAVEDVEVELKEALERVSTEVMARRRTDIETAATIAKVVPHENQEGASVAIAHIGDTRAYILRRNGELTQITTDEEGSFMAREQQGEVKTQIVDIGHTDRLLLLSRGLYEHATEDEIRSAFLDGDGRRRDRSRIDDLMMTAREKDDSVDASALVVRIYSKQLVERKRAERESRDADRQEQRDWRVGNTVYIDFLRGTAAADRDRDTQYFPAVIVRSFEEDGERMLQLDSVDQALSIARRVPFGLAEEARARFQSEGVLPASYVYQRRDVDRAKIAKVDSDYGYSRSADHRRAQRDAAAAQAADTATPARTPDAAADSTDPAEEEKQNAIRTYLDDLNGQDTPLVAGAPDTAYGIDYDGDGTILTPEEVIAKLQSGDIEEAELAAHGIDGTEAAEIFKNWWERTKLPELEDRADLLDFYDARADASDMEPDVTAEEQRDAIWAWFEDTAELGATVKIGRNDEFVMISNTGHPATAAETADEFRRMPEDVVDGIPGLAGLGITGEQMAEVFTSWHMESVPNWEDAVRFAEREVVRLLDSINDNASLGAFELDPTTGEVNGFRQPDGTLVERRNMLRLFMGMDSESVITDWTDMWVDPTGKDEELMELWLNDRFATGTAERHHEGVEWQMEALKRGFDHLTADGTFVTERVSDDPGVGYDIAYRHSDGRLYDVNDIRDFFEERLGRPITAAVDTAIREWWDERSRVVTGQAQETRPSVSDVDPERALHLALDRLEDGDRIMILHGIFRREFPFEASTQWPGQYEIQALGTTLLLQDVIEEMQNFTPDEVREMTGFEDMDGPQLLEAFQLWWDVVRRPAIDREHTPGKKILDIPERTLIKALGKDRLMTLLQDSFINRLTTGDPVVDDPASLRAIFVDLSREEQQELERILAPLGYTYREFQEAWQDHLHEQVFESIKRWVQQEELRIVNEMLGNAEGMWEKTKGGVYAEHAKRMFANLVPVGIGVGAGIGVAMSAGVGGWVAGGLIGSAAGFAKGMNKVSGWLKKRNEKHMKAAEQKTQAVVEKMKQEKLAEMKRRLAERLGQMDGIQVAAFFSQGIRESSYERFEGRDENLKDVNAFLLRSSMRDKVGAEYTRLDREAKSAELDNLVRQLNTMQNQEREQIAGLLAAIPKFVAIVEKVFGYPPGTLARESTDQPVEEEADVVRPVTPEKAKTVIINVLVGGTMGAVFAAEPRARSIVMGIVGGYVGYKMGEKADEAARERAFRNEVSGQIEKAELLINRSKDSATVRTTPGLESARGTLDGYAISSAAELGDSELTEDRLVKTMRAIRTPLNLGLLVDHPSLEVRAKNVLRRIDALRFEVRRRDERAENLISTLQEDLRKLQDDRQEAIERIGSTKGWRKYAGAVLGGTAGYLAGELRGEAAEKFKELFGTTPEAAPAAATGAAAGTESVLDAAKDGALETAREVKLPSYLTVGEGEGLSHTATRDFLYNDQVRAAYMKNVPALSGLDQGRLDSIAQTLQSNGGDFSALGKGDRSFIANAAKAISEHNGFSSGDEQIRVSTADRIATVFDARDGRHRLVMVDASGKPTVDVNWAEELYGGEYKEIPKTIADGIKVTVDPESGDIKLAQASDLVDHVHQTGKAHGIHVHFKDGRMVHGFAIEDGKLVLQPGQDHYMHGVGYGLSEGPVIPGGSSTAGEIEIGGEKKMFAREALGATDIQNATFASQADLDNAMRFYGGDAGGQITPDAAPGAADRPPVAANDDTPVGARAGEGAVAASLEGFSPVEQVYVRDIEDQIASISAIRTNSSQRAIDLQKAFVHNLNLQKTALGPNPAELPFRVDTAKSPVENLIDGFNLDKDSLVFLRGVTEVDPYFAHPDGSHSVKFYDADLGESFFEDKNYTFKPAPAGERGFLIEPKDGEAFVGTVEIRNGKMEIVPQRPALASAA